MIRLIQSHEVVRAIELERDCTQHGTILCRSSCSHLAPRLWDGSLDAVDEEEGGEGCSHRPNRM